MYERIKELCSVKGTNITALERELGFAKGSLCKIDKNKPSGEKLQKIADYFNISIEFLKTGKEKELPEFEPDHIELIRLYSKLNEEQKKTVMTMMRSLALQD